MRDPTVIEVTVRDDGADVECHWGVMPDGSISPLAPHVRLADGRLVPVYEPPSEPKHEETRRYVVRTGR